MEARLAGGAERILIPSLTTLVSITFMAFTDLLSLSTSHSRRFTSVRLVFRVGTAYLLLYATLSDIGSHFVALDCESRTRAAGGLMR